MPPTSTNPNDSWASANRSGPTVPRSTSVEYEKETQSTVNRRLAPPPNRRAVRPISKTASVHNIPGSEDEDETPREQVRGKSPFEQIVDLSKRFAPTQFLMRQRSQEPEAPEQANGNASHDQSTSYEYSAEEREYQATIGQKHQSRHRRNRMSTDNKAYRPTVSDLEETDEDVSDDGKRTRRRKKKNGAPGGPLTSLPVAGYDKRRKKKRGTKENGVDGEEESDEDEDESDDEQQEITRVSEQVGELFLLGFPV